MPNILKRFTQPSAKAYVFQEAAELSPMDEEEQSLTEETELSEEEAEEEELLNAEGPAILAVDGAEEEIPEFDLNEELREIKNDRGMALKKSIREFAEQNPEISAQLLKNWLNGGSGDGTN